MFEASPGGLDQVPAPAGPGSPNRAYAGSDQGNGCGPENIRAEEREGRGELCMASKLYQQVKTVSASGRRIDGGRSWMMAWWVPCGTPQACCSMKRSLNPTNMPGAIPKTVPAEAPPVLYPFFRGPSADEAVADTGESFAMLHGQCSSGDICPLVEVAGRSRFGGPSTRRAAHGARRRDGVCRSASGLEQSRASHVAWPAGPW